MTRITLDAIAYGIEFHHIRTNGAHARLNPRHSPVSALTVCTVTAQDAPTGKLLWVASDVALCAHGDNFSRHEGRVQSFSKLLRFNHGVRSVAPLLAAKYVEVSGDDVEVPASV